jgi:hypothetical protein
MSRDVGIWIDHQRAVIVHAAREGSTTETVESDVAPHPRYAGQQDSGGEKKYEERHGHDLDRYYDAVIERLAKPERLLILGPGEAKGELRERFTRAKSHAACTVDVETTDKLTDRQILSRVKTHFGVDG